MKLLRLTADDPIRLFDVLKLFVEPVGYLRALVRQLREAGDPVTILEAIE